MDDTDDRPDGRNLARLTQPSRELLARVVQSGRSERFAYTDVVRAFEVMRFSVALDALIDLELVERVPDGACGKWFLRVTAAGLKAATEGAPKRKKPLRGKAIGRRPRASAAARRNAK